MPLLWTLSSTWFRTNLAIYTAVFLIGPGCCTPELVDASCAMAPGGSRLARLKPCWLKKGAAAAAAAA